MEHVLEHLRGLHGDMTAMRDDIREIKRRVAGLEQATAGHRSEAASTLGEQVRQQATLDKITERIERIEKQLEIYNC